MSSVNLKVSSRPNGHSFQIHANTFHTGQNKN